MTDVRQGPVTFLPDLAGDERLRASVERLLQPDYAVEEVMRQTAQGDWPGDLAGRLLLSLARYARAGMPTLERAVALNAAMLSALGPQGYFGPKRGDVFREQQVACHGWVVSGLLQYYYVTGDERSRRAALRVVDELLQPAVSHLVSYPWRALGGKGADAGAAAGTAIRVMGHWLVSTDTWCVLLALNGLVPAAVETNRDDLYVLIGSVAEALSDLDPTAVGAQLHAVLAASRNLADLAKRGGDDRAGDVAARLYGCYVAAGRTLNYATYNWFGRPDSWTEPCAVVDSLGAAHALHRLTGESGYLGDAVRIARNGLAFAERIDGSFGLDSIATPYSPVLRPLVYDAHWCCTMRGAIGLLEARECAAQFDAAANELLLADLYPGTHLLPKDAGDGWRIRVHTRYPADDRLRLEVESCPPDARPLRVGMVGSSGAAAPLATLMPVPGGTTDVVMLSESLTEPVAGGEVQEFQGPILIVRSAGHPPPRDSAARHRLPAVAGRFGPVDRPEVFLTRRADAADRRSRMVESCTTARTGPLTREG